MTREPNTPRPNPDELSEGTRLRVEWSGAWWAAKVKEVSEDRIKVGFDTWSSNYDEWMPRDSTRLRTPAPGDVEVEPNTAIQSGLAARRSDFPAPEDVPTMSGRQRPFVPKPYNPEKEFAKRQLRLREKIANMQRSKLGDVDSSLQSLKSIQGTRFPLTTEEKPVSASAAPTVQEAAAPAMPASPAHASTAQSAGTAEIAVPPPPVLPEVVEPPPSTPQAATVQAETVKIEKAAVPAKVAEPAEIPKPAQTAKEDESADSGKVRLAEVAKDAKAEGEPIAGATIR